MFNLVLVASGLAILIFSVVKLASLLKLISDKVLRKWWVILLVLILLFCIGYLLFGFYLVTDSKAPNGNPMSDLVSLVFFFGAIFVLVAISLIYKTIKNLGEETVWVKAVNKQLMETQSSLETAKKSLSETNTAIKEKIEELEKTNSLMVGRELRMVELKKEIEELKKKVEF